jgi:hypothetical protein
MSLVECPQGVKGVKEAELKSALAKEQQRAKEIKQKKEKEEAAEKKLLEDAAKIPAPEPKGATFGWTGRRGR